MKPEFNISAVRDVGKHAADKASAATFDAIALFDNNNEKMGVCITVISSVAAILAAIISEENGTDIAEIHPIGLAIECLELIRDAKNEPDETTTAVPEVK